MEKGNKNFSDIDISLMTMKFKLLSEVSRMKILRSLFDGEKCVSNIMSETGLLQANVSKQLKILQSSGIIDCRADGLQRYYRVIDSTIMKICQIVCQNTNGKG